MGFTGIAAIIFACITVIVILFMAALTLGAPLGHLTMGGRWPGKLPLPARVLVVLQACLLAIFTLIVLAHAGVWESRNFPPMSIWVVVMFSGLSLVANLATPSRWERALWAPAGAIMLATSLLVALG